MPFPSSPPARSGPRRRSLLAVAPAALALTGCTGGDSGGPAGEGRPAADRARARAARDSEALVERYDAVIAARPGLAGRLRPLREETVRHARALGGGRKASPSASPSASASSSATPSASAAVPGNDKDALAGLAAAEKELADRRARVLGGVPGELARLLASVAAAGAAHVYLLTEGDA
ncbi:hypothetical protein [Streptomyces cahuitamycinicus]|uniref:Lipoprotein n=1 Tax=Streptomyces cahuitamycinicus TaxID=2070367 RepID=A0A2N8TCK8_9ACTN|nr:hypothetical protein [Streptomyces cahuitamycinicus]PNG16684.1 hypothetical protein C1J00_40565 [Streptomyces cahuitamycinicus]